MIYEGKSLITMQQQFHTRAVSFEDFKNITDKDIQRIKEQIKAHSKNTKKIYGTNLGLMNYINTLQYLINPTISLELKTFDEKVLYLILSCDPNLEMMDAFLSSEITPLQDIEDAAVEARKALKEQRNKEIALYESEVRKRIGFYDPKLLRYESLLHRGLFKKEGFVADVKSPSIGSLLKRSEKIENINIINALNLLRLKSIAERWAVEAKDPKDLNSLAYNLLNRYKDLHIYTVEEQVILFMLVADPELDLLRIYEEESTIPKMEARAIEEIGFYNKGLVNVEKLYHQKFEPEKQISAWTI